MEYTIRPTDEELYNLFLNSTYTNYGPHNFRHSWDHHAQQGFIAIKVPKKGRARWLKRHGSWLETLGFSLQTEEVVK